MASVDGSRAMQGLSDESLLFECSPCKYEGIRREAASFCQECGDYLCDGCKLWHQRFTGTRNHQVVSGNLIPEGRDQSGKPKPIPVICVCNCGEVTVCCKDHHIIVREDCKMLKHRNCVTQTVDEACASIESSSTDQTHSRMKQLKDNFETLQKKRMVDMDSLATQTAECRNMVGTFKKELIQHIEEMSESALEEIRKCEADESSTIQQHITLCRTALNRLNADYRHFDDASTSADKRSMFIRNLQLTQTMNDVDHVLKDIEKEVKEPGITFECDRTLKQTDKKCLGIVKSALAKNKELSCLINTNVISTVKVDVKSTSDKRDPYIYGSVFMPSGELVLCDGANNSIKLLNLDYTFKEMINVPVCPWGVSAMNNEEVVVSLPTSPKLQFIKVLPKLQMGSSINLDQDCRGVAVKDEMIYVSFYSGEIRVLNRDGQHQTKICTTYQFKGTLYISVTQAGILAVSEFLTGNVRVLKNGKEMFSSSNPELKNPRGLYIDGEENILVCGYHSNNVHMIDKSGKLIKILLSESDGLYRPCTISFRPSDNTLVVGGITRSLIVCKLG